MSDDKFGCYTVPLRNQCTTLSKSYDLARNLDEGTWEVYRHRDGITTVDIDINHVDVYIELTEADLVAMLQEIRSPRM